MKSAQRYSTNQVDNKATVVQELVPKGIAE